MHQEVKPKYLRMKISGYVDVEAEVVKKLREG